MASANATVNPPRHSPVYNPPDSLHDGSNVPSLRVPRTHSGPGVIQLFKSLSLRAKLKMCQDIEDQNDDRHKKTFLHTTDPLSHPEPGSETASMFTIDDEDLRRLKRPSYAAMFKDVMPAFLMDVLFDRELATPHTSRSDLKHDGDFIVETRVAKRCCIDGTSLAPRTIDAPADIKFPQIMFDTEQCGMIPLPLFLNSSILYITVNAASLPTFKANPKPDQKKGYSVIDCKKVLVQLNLAELEIDNAQWAEASYNCFRFQCERDVVESGGAYSAWWDHHFNFFNFQMDKNEYYDAWKAMELELRQDFYAHPCAYNADYYARKYDIVKCSYDLKRRMQSPPPTPTSPTSDNSKSSLQPTDI
ncbi:hypothetical protein GALMADRAFT_136969 [Galerina marginata CBS 339.88]|uniref:Uncharacterized protein n=1 Tax=Galerina marginata (strain CBS 339.88) TaxID=685588 RepID=A0A067TBJ8_GALM3|nr:hypothetical protein GALMADRAFT_136969 [Galerina marginata CBS 339.88]